MWIFDQTFSLHFKYELDRYFIYNNINMLVMQILVYFPQKQLLHKMKSRLVIIGVRGLHILAVVFCGDYSIITITWNTIKLLACTHRFRRYTRDKWSSLMGHHSC